jgi:hypothetical protein
VPKNLTFNTLLCLLLFAFVGAPSLLAQRITASLEGTVKDTNGAVIPNAAVAVTNTGTGVVTRANTTSEGNFSISNLPPGPYSVAVTAPGFKRLVRNGLVLDVDQTAHLDDLVLPLGQVAETVEVTSSEPLLETQTSDVGQVIGNKSIENLPLNQRNPLALVLLVPGVTGTVGSSFTGMQFNVNGGRSGTTDVLLDGIPSAPPTDDFNALTIFPSVDATQEFKVQTSNFSAQFGNTGGGVINIVYKSGTNDIHGSVYDFLRNSYLDANNFFSDRAGVALPSFKRNQFGFSLGGPIFIPKLYNGRDRTFFFVDYEGLRQDTATQLLTTVPTSAERMGDFSHDVTSGGAPIVIYDPASTTATTSSSGTTYTRTAFQNNYINPTRFDKVATNVLAYFPLPNLPGVNGHNNYFAAASTPYTINQYDIKVDEVISHRQRISFRFSKRNPVTGYAPLLPAATEIALNASSNAQPAIGAGLDYTFAKNSNYIFELRAGVSHVYYNTTTPGDGFDPTQLGFPSYLATAALATSANSLTFPGFAPSGYLGIGEGTQLSKGGAGYLADTFLVNNTKVLSKQILNFGGEFRILANNDNQLGRATGAFSFGTNFTQGPNALSASSTAGDGFASFLLGLGSGTVTHYFKIVDTTSHYGALYLQDDWSPTEKLTFNLGIRYDLFVPRTERHDRATWLDLNVLSPLAATSGIAGLKGGLEYPGVNGDPRQETDTEYANVAPRLGFAFHPFRPLALRGAYGIFFTNNPNQAASTVQNTGYRTDSSYLGTIDGATPNNYLSNPFPNSSFVPVTGNSLGLLTGTGGGVSASIRHQPSPYTENYNLGVEYQLPANWLIGVAYVGSHGVQLPYYPTYNQLPDADLALGGQLLNPVANPLAGQVQVAGAISGTTIQKRYLLSPYPQFTSVAGYLVSGAISHYDSMQVRAEKRFSRSGTLLLSYTGAKSMDDTSYGNNSNFGTNGTYQDASIPLFQDSYSLSTFDISRNLVISGVYNLPLGRGQRFGSHWNGFVDAIFGGYQINGIFSAHDGTPLALSASNVANILNPGERPNWNGQNPRKPGRVEDKLNGYFVTTDFSQPAIYTFGNMSRTHGYLRGPGLRNFDLSAFKQFEVVGRLRAELRGEAFNAFNTPQFSNPDTGVTDGTFGVISSQANSPRQVQVALKLLF